MGDSRNIIRTNIMDTAIESADIACSRWWSLQVERERGWSGVE